MSHRRTHDSWHPRLVALLLLATLASCGSDQRACTLIGCNSGIEITFDPPLTAPGTYTVDVEIDGVLTRCEAALPFRAEGVDGCHSMDALLFLSGTALPSSGQSLPGMHLQATSASAVRIVIKRDSTEVANATSSPSYSMSYPNGRECDLVPCVSASMTIATGTR
jgi:hypothetical protein